MNLKAVRDQAYKKLKNHSDSAKLDVDLLLALVLEQDRAFIHAHPEYALTQTQYDNLYNLLNRRCAGEPLAYLRGTQEFWSFNFKVTPATLIPRPETEVLVETALTLPLALSTPVILDLGTGSGNIAISLAKERPDWQVYATDINQQTLAVANENAQNLQAKITFYQSDWFDALPNDFKSDVIISNPPYIDTDDNDVEPAVRQFEPAQALFAAENGLCDLKYIIDSAQLFLNSGGWLLLEHGFQQSDFVKTLLINQGFVNIRVIEDQFGKKRAVVAQKLA